MCDHCKLSETIWSYGGYQTACKGCQIRHAATLIRMMRVDAIKSIASRFNMPIDDVMQAVKDEYKRWKALKDKTPSLF